MMRMEIAFEQRNTTLFATLWRDPPKDAAPMERDAHDRIWNALTRFCEANKIALHITATPSSPQPKPKTRMRFPRANPVLSPPHPPFSPVKSTLFKPHQASSTPINPPPFLFIVVNAALDEPDPGPLHDACGHDLGRRRGRQGRDPFSSA